MILVRSGMRSPLDLHHQKTPPAIFYQRASMAGVTTNRATRLVHRGVRRDIHLAPRRCFHSPHSQRPAMKMSILVPAFGTSPLLTLTCALELASHLLSPPPELFVLNRALIFPRLPNIDFLPSSSPFSARDDSMKERLDISLALRTAPSSSRTPLYQTRACAAGDDSCDNVIRALYWGCEREGADRLRHSGMLPAGCELLGGRGLLRSRVSTVGLWLQRHER